MDREQVVALAPDSASVSAAQKLNAPAKWPLLKQSSRALWGECKGSGKKPYQTRIDLQGNAFKCSCPSRKFPCKHGLALFLLYVEQAALFEHSQDMPSWVTEWLDGRDGRAENKKKKAENKKPVDEKARLKRQQKREEKVDSGVAELQQWLQDVVRLGLSDLPTKPYSYWGQLAARMVDAQAPGLANWVQRLGEGVASGSVTMSSLSEQIAQLHLLIQAYAKLAQVDTPLQADIRSLIGFPFSEEDVLSQPGVSDQWWVIVRRQSEQNSLVMQEVWLRGLASGRFAKIIQYAHSTQRQSLICQWNEGDRLQGALHFYPSATPLRAVVGEHSVIVATDFPCWEKTKEDPLGAYQQLRVANPWLAAYPVMLPFVVPVVSDGKFMLLSDNKRCITLNTLGIDAWKMLGLSGGHPMNIFGEWNGALFTPLVAWVEKEQQTIEDYHSLISLELTL